MKKKLVCFLGILIVGCVLNSCWKKDKKEEKPKPIRPVKVVTAKLLKHGKVKSFSGVTRASITSRLSFRVSGTLTDLLVDVGDRVEKGKLLAKLDPTDYEIKVQEVSASLARAEAQWRNAKASYARVQALYERGNASMNELDATRAAASSGEAAVKSVKKQRELVKRRLGYTNLYAPDRCSVASLYAEENENLGAGQPLMLLNCGNLTEVKMAVPSTYIDKIKKGVKVSVKIDSFENTIFNGTIKDVGVSPSGMMTTYPVIIALESENSMLRPGMSAEVDLRTSGDESMSFIWLPPVCVGEDVSGKFVFIVLRENEKFGIIKKVNVETDKISGFGIPVTKGLNPGDIVVKAGLSQIRDGLKVSFYEEDI